MKPQDAEEYTQALGQVVAGGWRQIGLGVRLGVPKALKLSIDAWVKERLGGYVQLSLTDRFKAAEELKETGLKTHEIAEVIGVTPRTIQLDKKRSAKPFAPKRGRPKKHTSKSTKPFAPLDTITAIAADDDFRKRIDRDNERQQRESEKVARRAASVAAAQQVIMDGDLNVRVGPCQQVSKKEVADGSVALIFTDPPYHDKTIDLYTDLGRIAARVLPEGGNLITYIPQHRIPEIIAMMQRAGLTFLWPLAIVLTSAPWARLREWGIVVHWKPLLWFVKGRTGGHAANLRFVDDLVESPQADKVAHPWQQSIQAAHYYIEKLTQPGDLVFDPFCGGGTTAVAARQLGRRWLTCDVDADAATIARARVAEALNANGVG